MKGKEGQIVTISEGGTTRIQLSEVIFVLWKGGRLEPATRRLAEKGMKNIAFKKTKALVKNEQEKSPTSP